MDLASATSSGLLKKPVSLLLVLILNPYKLLYPSHAVIYYYHEDERFVSSCVTLNFIPTISLSYTLHTPIWR
jgi:hypothetical protein